MRTSSFRLGVKKNIICLSSNKKDLEKNIKLFIKILIDILMII